MYVITRSRDDVIVMVSNVAKEIENGIDVGGIVLGEGGLLINQVTSVPPEVTPRKYCYTTAHGFFVSSNPADTADPAIEELNEQLASVKQELDDLYLFLADLISV